MEFHAQIYSQQEGSKILISHKKVIKAREQTQKHVSWVSNHIPQVADS